MFHTNENGKIHTSGHLRYGWSPGVGIDDLLKNLDAIDVKETG